MLSSRRLKSQEPIVPHPSQQSCAASVGLGGGGRLYSTSAGWEGRNFSVFESSPIGLEVITDRAPELASGSSSVRTPRADREWLVSLPSALNTRRASV